MREDGYYWIQRIIKNRNPWTPIFHKEPEVANWKSYSGGSLSGVWWLCGEEMEMEDTHVVVISERLVCAEDKQVNSEPSSDVSKA